MNKVQLFITFILVFDLGFIGGLFWKSLFEADKNK